MLIKITNGDGTTSSASALPPDNTLVLAPPTGETVVAFITSSDGSKQEIKALRIITPKTE